MEVSAIIFKAGAYGKLRDLGSNNSQRIAASKNATLTIDEELRVVRVTERRGEDVVNDYLAPFEALSMIELKQPEAKLEQRAPEPQRAQAQGQRR